MSLTQSRSMGAGTTRAAAASSLPKLVALAWSGASTNVYTSSTGTSWTKTNRTTPTVFSNASPGGIAPSELTSNGTSLLVAQGGYTAITNDMSTWTSGTATGACQCYWNGSTWVASGSNQNTTTFNISTSTDGSTWTSRFTGTSSETSGRGIYAGTYNVLTSSDGIYYTSTADGSSGWTKKVILAASTMQGVAHNGSRFVVVGQDSSGNPRIYQATAPTASFSVATVTGATAPWYDVAWNGTTFVAVGGNGTNGQIATSTNAVSWTLQSAVSSSNDFYSVCWSTSLSLFVGSTIGGLIYTSPDGVTWTSRYTDSGQFIAGITATS